MRRLHLPALTAGNIQLPPDQAHHLRDVLRFKSGDELEIFDDAGNTAAAIIAEISPQAVTVRIEKIQPPTQSRFHLTIASAVPKAARADWMIEKLSELGVDEFIPLATSCSVALPEGASKRDRWIRLAAESAKQSRRQGVMRIEKLTKIQDLLAEYKKTGKQAWYLSTQSKARPLVELAAKLPSQLTLLIGPEGGWSEDEIALFSAASIEAALLTSTILRTETAAIAAAAVVSVESSFRRLDERGH